MPATDLAISFFTALTVLANIAALGIVGSAAAASVNPGPRRERIWSTVRAELSGGGVALAWLVAAVATGGSLYFSEAADFVPCRLCWAQRAFMYPLVAILAAAAAVPALRRWGRRLGLVFAGAGAAVATYHVLVERYPSLESGACDPTNPCSLVWFERLGFVTLPYMALSAFLLIAVLLVASPAATEPTKEHTS